VTPAARAQAAIELLDQIITAAREAGPAADTIISAYFKTRRYAGSKDRRAVRELVYRAIRRSGERPISGRAALLGLAQDDSDLIALFDGSPHGPAPPKEDDPAAPASGCASWLEARFDPLVTASEMPPLLERAPLDLRVNRLKGDRAEAAAALPEAAPTPLSPIGLRLPEGFQVEQSQAWERGLVEVQDEGSQLLALGCGARPGMKVIDLCAGAGGKTLALAAEMANEGQLLAADTDRGRLSRMQPRLARAGVTIVKPLLLDPGRSWRHWRIIGAKPTSSSSTRLVRAPAPGGATRRRGGG
jgi:16S rRNA (cytosine967-C5)-methyltransferase